MTSQYMVSKIKKAPALLGLCCEFVFFGGRRRNGVLGPHSNFQGFQLAMFSGAHSWWCFEDHLWRQGSNSVWTHAHQAADLP